MKNKKDLVEEYLGADPSNSKNPVLEDNMKTALDAKFALDEYQEKQKELNKEKEELEKLLEASKVSDKNLSYIFSSEETTQAKKNIAAINANLKQLDKKNKEATTLYDATITTSKELIEKGNLANNPIALHQALLIGDKDLTGAIIAKYNNKPELYNEKDSQGRTALHIAAMIGSMELEDITIESPTKTINPPKTIDLSEKIDISAKDKDGRTALDYAVESKNNEAAEKLIAKYLTTIDTAEPGQQKELKADLNNAFTLAIKSGNEDMFEALKDNGNIDLLYGDKDGKTALDHAIESGETDFAKGLIAEYHNKVKTIDGFGNNSISTEQGNHIEKLSSALVVAVKNGNAEIAKEILTKDGDQSSLRAEKILEQKDKERKTPLHYAAESIQSKEMLGALLENMSSEKSFELLKTVDKDGKTPVHIAAEKGDIAALKSMVENIEGGKEGALFDMTDDKTPSPFQLAAKKGSIEIFEFMLSKKGLKIEEVFTEKFENGPNKGKTLVDIAIENGNLDLVDGAVTKRVTLTEEQRAAYGKEQDAQIAATAKAHDKDKADALRAAAQGQTFSDPNDTKHSEAQAAKDDGRDWIGASVKDGKKIIGDPDGPHLIETKNQNGTFNYEMAKVPGATGTQTMRIPRKGSNPKSYDKIQFDNETGTIIDFEEGIGGTSKLSEKMLETCRNLSEASISYDVEKPQQKSADRTPQQVSETSQQTNSKIPEVQPSAIPENKASEILETKPSSIPNASDTKQPTSSAIPDATASEKPAEDKSAGNAKQTTDIITPGAESLEKPDASDTKQTTNRAIPEAKSLETSEVAKSAAPGKTPTSSENPEIENNIPFSGVNESEQKESQAKTTKSVRFSGIPNESDKVVESEVNTPSTPPSQIDSIPIGERWGITQKDLDPTPINDSNVELKENLSTEANPPTSGKKDEIKITTYDKNQVKASAKLVKFMRQNKDKIVKQGGVPITKAKEIEKSTGRS